MFYTVLDFFYFFTWNLLIFCVIMVLDCFTQTWKIIVYVTVWKVAKHGVFYSPYFPVFGLWEYGITVFISRIRENTDQKKTLYTQWVTYLN